MMTCILYLVITILLLLLQYHHVAASVSITSNYNATNTITEMSRDMQQKLALFQFKLNFSIDTSPQECDTVYDFNDKLISIPVSISWRSKKMNWIMDSDYCKWDGVTCNHTTGDVIGLDLSCRCLVGSINPNSTLFQLSHLQFSGPLPAEYIKNFKGMMNEEVNKVPLDYMGDSYYSDSISLVIKGVEMEYVKILTVFTTIDISRNKFNGEIPRYIGNLVSLRGLNLSHNNLTGSIPSTIGNLFVLESLDFSSNHLVGEIPQQLTDIDFLEKLNLSQNDLNGRIPESPHFTTFENNSYSGNPGLCGFPLSKKCRGDNVELQEEDGEGDDYFFNGFSWEPVVIGYGCGVVVGFVGGYIMFMTGKPKWYVGIIARELGLKVKRIEIVRR